MGVVYPGDRLNFGLAAEQAKAEGFNVEVVIVGDDCALPHTGPTRRRGVAGVALTFKVLRCICLMIESCLLPNICMALLLMAVQRDILKVMLSIGQGKHSSSCPAS